MLSRLFSKSSNLRFLTLISSQTHFLQNPNPPIFLSITKRLYPYPANPNFFSRIPHFYSTTNNNNKKKNGNTQGSSPNPWQLSSETEEGIDSIFGTGSETKALESDPESWPIESLDSDEIFKGVEEGEKGGGVSVDEWATAEGYKPWSISGDNDDKEEAESLFDVGAGGGDGEVGREGENVEWGLEDSGSKKTEEQERPEIEEKALTSILKG